MRRFAEFGLIALVVTVSAISCKKDDPEPTQPDPAPAVKSVAPDPEPVAAPDPTPPVTTPPVVTPPAQTTPPAAVTTPPADPPTPPAETPPAEDEPDDLPAPDVLETGEQAFVSARCTNCHQEDGTGGERAPNLTDADWLHCDGSIEGILAVLKSGVPRDKLKDPNRRFGMRPATNSIEDEETLAALAAYVRSLSQSRP